MVARCICLIICSRNDLFNRSPKDLLQYSVCISEVVVRVERNKTNNLICRTPVKKEQPLLKCWCKTKRYYIARRTDRRAAGLISKMRWSYLKSTTYAKFIVFECNVVRGRFSRLSVINTCTRDTRNFLFNLNSWRNKNWCYDSKKEDICLMMHSVAMHKNIL